MEPEGFSHSDATSILHSRFHIIGHKIAIPLTGRGVALCAFCKGLEHAGHLDQLQEAAEDLTNACSTVEEPRVSTVEERRLSTVEERRLSAA